MSYISQDCEEIPEFLGRKYGHMAKRLDLSFNLLRYVALYRFSSAIWDTNSKNRYFFFQSRNKHVCQVHLVVIKRVTLFYRQCLSPFLAYLEHNQVSLEISHVNINDAQ